MSSIPSGVYYNPEVFIENVLKEAETHHIFAPSEAEKGLNKLPKGLQRVFLNTSNNKKPFDYDHKEKFVAYDAQQHRRFSNHHIMFRRPERRYQ
jgi:hypothetical protein